jgi:hypothetical protein
MQKSKRMTTNAVVLKLKLKLMLVLEESVAKLLSTFMAPAWTVYVVKFFTHGNGYG